MPTYGPNRRLTALLAEADWSDASLARAVNALATAQGLGLNYSRASVAHWRRGSRPPAPVPALAAEALSRRVGRPITPYDTGLTPLSATQTAELPQQATSSTPVRQLLALARSDIDPLQRTALQRAAYAPIRPAGTPPTTFPAAPAPPHTSPLVTNETAALQSILHTFTNLAQQYGGRCARTALAAYLAEDICTLLERRANHPDRHRIFTYAAQLTHHLAVMTDDAGYHHLAHRYFTTALSLAHYAGCRKTYAITLRTMSAQALRLGHLHHAHTLAESSTHIAGLAAHPALTAYIRIQQALTAAHDGQPSLARKLMHAAENSHEELSEPSEPFDEYPLAALHYQRAAVFQALEQHTEALTALQASARHRDPCDRRSLALTHAHIAATQLRIADMDAACLHWHTFLSLYRPLQSGRADQHLLRLRQSLLPHRAYPPAKALLDRTQSLSRERRP
ncbi:hypothetical protein ACH4FX_42210 [Streptomyces sp. NPDC018019]|uniref:hypothetical protein n=1 Tax=Streptomyces sp. NPDC018019 TaxID=3365030 RepID=UPI0037913965